MPVVWCGVLDGGDDGDGGNVGDVGDGNDGGDGGMVCPWCGAECWMVASLPQPAAMLTCVLVSSCLLLSASAQYATCPEPYGLQVYPHDQYCDKFYKCANGKL